MQAYDRGLVDAPKRKGDGYQEAYFPEDVKIEGYFECESSNSEIEEDQEDSPMQVKFDFFENPENSISSDTGEFICFDLYRFPRKELE